MITNKLKSLINSIDSKGLFVLKGFTKEFSYDLDKIEFHKLLEIDTAQIINSN